MSLTSFFKTWKNTNLTWAIIEPFVLKLIEKKVPSAVTKLYENLAKYSQPAITSLESLKAKIKSTPNSLDDYCFNQGVDALETFAKYLLDVTKKLRS